MNHDAVQFLARVILYMLLFLVPLSLVFLRDRFPRQPRPAQYATFLAVIGIIGLLLALPVLALIAATALGAIGIAWLSGRYALSGLKFERLITPARLFPDDTAELTISLENRKPLPLAWLTLADPIKHALAQRGSDLNGLLSFSAKLDVLDTLGYGLVNRAAVGPFQRVTRVYQMTALHRGVYAFGPAVLSSGDPFGIFPHQAVLGRREELLVYPNVFTPDEIGIPFREALGNLAARGSLVEDPTLLAGSREYRPGDSMRRIHWKATAFSGELQVRVNDPSTTAQLMIVLNLNTFLHAWQGVDLDRVESTIDVAASLALSMLGRDFAVGLRSNGILPRMEGAPRIAPSANPRQPLVILEHLARMSYSGYAAEGVLMEEAERLPAGGSIALVTSIITPGLLRVLSSRRMKNRIVVLYCGRIAAPVISGVPVYLATHPKEAIRAVS